MRRKNRGSRRSTAVIVGHTDGDPKAVDRALDTLATAIDSAAARPLAAAGQPVDVDLSIGTNNLDHGLGRPVLGFLAMPVVAADPIPGFDPSQPGNSQPKRQVQIVSTVAARYRIVLF